MLLPHGFEGQGPEHSSARFERFLQLCANNNMQVCQCSAPAQYFHLLRRQMKQLAAKPLIIITPKSLLRLPAASSPLDQLVTGSFAPLLDTDAGDPEKVARVIFCSGKLYYELASARKSESTRLIRLEQFYPFPYQQARAAIHNYASAREWIWAQEEPQNMGGWTFIAPRLQPMLPQRLQYAGRPPAASPATGSFTIHQMEQQQLIAEALGTIAKT